MGSGRNAGCLSYIGFYHPVLWGLQILGLSLAHCSVLEKYFITPLPQSNSSIPMTFPPQLYNNLGKPRWLTSSFRLSVRFTSHSVIQSLFSRWLQFALEPSSTQTKKLGIIVGLDIPTPPQTNMEPQNWWLVDVSPFPRGHLQVPCLFSGVYPIQTQLNVLDGDVKCFFLCSPLGEMIPFDEHMFGEKPPTSN